MKTNADFVGGLIIGYLCFKAVKCVEDKRREKEREREVIRCKESYCHYILYDKKKGC